MYTDDMTGYVQDEEDFKTLNKTLDIYCRTSGGHLNADKSSVIHLGPPFPCHTKPSLKTAQTDS
jgi:hypothetical protein